MAARLVKQPGPEGPQGGTRGGQLGGDQVTGFAGRDLDLEGRDQPAGGATVTEAFARANGADGYGAYAPAAVAQVNAFLGDGAAAEQRVP